MIIFFIFIVFFNFLTLKADEISYADSHGPISIMGDHVHKENEYMFSYRLMSMQMKNLFQGINKIPINRAMSSPNGSGDSKGTYMNAPDTMSMDMHMFGAMYAPSNFLTIMLMGSYNQKEMTQNRMPMAGGSLFDVNSSGFGDIRATMLFKIYNSKKWKNHSGIGFSFPTGSTSERDNTPMSGNAILGYGMQNGTGTYDTYFIFNNVNEIGKFKIGEQFYFKIPISGKNSHGYKYGKDIDVNFWVSYRFWDFLSSSFKINYKFKDKMIGSDNRMTRRMSPAMDSYNQGYQKVNLGFGLNLLNKSKYLKHHRIALEFIVPVYQNYRGIQMSEDFRLILGWQF